MSWRRGDGAVSGHDRTAHRPLEPFTVDHFRRYAGLLRLDTGDWWRPEPFQLEIAAALFAGYREIWVVLPEGNTKTTTTAGLVLYHADWTREARVPMAAASRDQCMTLFGQIAGFVRRSDLNGKRFKVLDGHRIVRALRTAGEIKVWAASEDTADSQIPTLAVVEELHRQTGLGLYRTWEGKLGKRTGQIWVISTRGEPGSEFEDAVAEFGALPHVHRAGAHTVARSDTAILLEWGLRPGDDLDDLQLVKQANPFTGVTLSELADKRGSPAFRAWHWARMTCGVPMHGGSASISPERWSALSCAEPPPHVTVDVGLDLGWVQDTTAAVALWAPERRHRVLGRPVVVEPPGNGESTPPRQVREALLRIRDRHPIRWVVLDTNAGGQQLVEFIERPYLDPAAREALAAELVEAGGDDVDPTLLAGLGATAVPHAQTDQPMAVAYDRLTEAIRENLLSHPHDQVLTTHVLAAVDKPVAGGRARFGKRARRRKATDEHGRRRREHNDALIAAAMVHSVTVAALEAKPRPKPTFEVI